MNTVSVLILIFEVLVAAVIGKILIQVYQKRQIGFLRIFLAVLAAGAGSLGLKVLLQVASGYFPNMPGFAAYLAYLCLQLCFSAAMLKLIIAFPAGERMSMKQALFTSFVMGVLVGLLNFMVTGGLILLGAITSHT